MNDGVCYKMRAFRMALGLSQEEVGEMVGASNAMISLYERGLYDSCYATKIQEALHAVKKSKIEKYGYWYERYIECLTALNEVEVWSELEGHIPESVIRKAKDAAVIFSNV